MIDLKIGSLYTLQHGKHSTIRKLFAGHTVKLLKIDVASSHILTRSITVELITVPEECLHFKGKEVRIRSLDLAEYKAVTNEEGLKLLNQGEF